MGEEKERVNTMGIRIGVKKLLRYAESISTVVTNVYFKCGQESQKVSGSVGSYLQVDGIRQRIGDREREQKRLYVEMMKDWGMPDGYEEVTRDKAIELLKDFGKITQGDRTLIDYLLEEGNKPL